MTTFNIKNRSYTVIASVEISKESNIAKINPSVKAMHTGIGLRGGLKDVAELYNGQIIEL